MCFSELFPEKLHDIVVASHRIHDYNISCCPQGDAKSSLLVQESRGIDDYSEKNWETLAIQAMKKLNTNLNNTLFN